MVREGVGQILAASKKLSDLMREQGCLESQSHSEKRFESLGAKSGADENGHEYVKECEAGAVAAVRPVGWSVVAVEWSGHVHANYEEQEVVLD